MSSIYRILFSLSKLYLFLFVSNFNHFKANWSRSKVRVYSLVLPKYEGIWSKPFPLIISPLKFELTISSCKCTNLFPLTSQINMHILTSVKYLTLKSLNRILQIRVVDFGEIIVLDYETDLDWNMRKSWSSVKKKNQNREWYLP